MPLTARLLEDLKKSWPKTAALGILLLVGMYFWIPPIWNAVAGRSPGTVPATSSAVPAPTNSMLAAEPDSDSSQRIAMGWEELQTVLQEDLLYASVDLDRQMADPFSVDLNQFPPPNLFAENDLDDGADRLTNSSGAAVVRNTQQSVLKLKSTFLGTRRRAAYINRKLYFEGMQVHDGAVWWLIESIQTGRVVLVRGDQRTELVIRPPGRQSTAKEPAEADSLVPAPSDSFDSPQTNPPVNGPAADTRLPFQPPR